ncbi:MAG: hypothetical protein Q7S68_02165 [Deltaproteobacteria bacterium]|nr:hypothetical protein [Deltaproteobacteria bacterium]
MKKKILLVLLPFILLIGCAKQDSATESTLTPGMTKKHIYPGKTNQTSVLEIFGPPDLVTHKHGKEVWTYDKISQEVVASQGFLTILFAGYSKTRQRQSSRSIMLIIYFNEKEVVEDYKLSAAKF